MLIACATCLRQYDADHLEVGERVRCLCGASMQVPERRSHVAQVRHCSACGASVEAGAERCEYCRGSILPPDREHGGTCPECFARLGVGARHCMECGISIAPTRVRILRVDAACPRCAEPLVQRITESATLTECSSCGGLWLPESFFQELVESKDLSPLGKSPVPPSPESREPEQVRYLKCPDCHAVMHRKNFASCSGVIIDWCRGHGFWFDDEELARIIRFVSEGGLDKARRLDVARAKQDLRRAKESADWGQRMRGSSSPGAPQPGSGEDLLADALLALIAAGISRLFRLFL